MKPKTVLITGCSSGIGAAMAIECHKRDYKVYATARDLSKLEDLKTMGIHCLQLDVNNDSELEKVLSDLVRDGQTIDFLINNAGYGAMAPIAVLSPESLAAQLDTNVVSILRVSNAFIPSMIEQKSGCIINIGSVSGVLTTPFAGAYCASKAAVHSLSDAYRMELKPFGIQVLTVQPGAIESAFGDNTAAITEGLIQNNSAYKPLESSVRRRAKASQERPTPAAEFARRLCDKMEKKNPPATIRIGNGSKLLPLLPHLIPTRLLDFLMAKPFKLDGLSD